MSRYRIIIDYLNLRRIAMSGKKDVPVRLTPEQRDRMINATRAINESAQQLMQREELRQSAQEYSLRAAAL